MKPQIDTDRLKSSVNIVDYIAQYIPLKKNGKDYSACCPFHNENTPSFTVSEDKQFFHCFGCGAHGDVLTWLKEYLGLDFMESVKLLGGEVSEMPPAKVQQNQSRINRARTPPDHKEDAILSAKILESCESIDGYYKSKSGQIYLPLTDCNGEIKNLATFQIYDKRKDTPEFMAGGLSYDCFYLIKKSDSMNVLCCANLQDGYKIASKYKLNVAVCFSVAVMRYLCMFNHGDFKMMPVLTKNNDDYLAHEMNWCSWDGVELVKRGVVK